MFVFPKKKNILILSPKKPTLKERKRPRGKGHGRKQPPHPLSIRVSLHENVNSKSYGRSRHYRPKNGKKLRQ
jgi:hypothetical protein